MKQVRFILVAILAVSFCAAATPVGKSSDTKWEQAKKTYISLLNYDNAGVKASAANHIRRYRIEEATASLKEVLACENCETVKIAAALALIEVSGDEGYAAIREALKSEENEMVAAFYRSVLQ